METTVNIPHHFSHECRERSFGQEKKKRAALAKQICPRVKQLTFLSCLPSLTSWEGPVVVSAWADSRLWGRYQWAKPDALSLGNLATHSCTAHVHLNAWTAGQQRQSTNFLFGHKARNETTVCPEESSLQRTRLSWKESGGLSHTKRD